MISHGLDPAEVIEFMRGDVVSLRGTAKAFASMTVKETATEGPRHVPYSPLDPAVKAALRRTRPSLVR
ncbi:MAG TPA: hypothetical protein VLL28_02570 [Hyphomicrobiaceae bacterium]|nr:hypothetical protein [Hyphomicrobiaceae bacterium]